MSTPVAPAAPPDIDRAAYDRTAAARAALDLSSTPPYTLDAVFASAQAHGIARRLAPYRTAIAALPGFDLGHLDQLEDFASALLFAHVTLVARANRVRQLPALAAEGQAHRNVLLAYAELLVLKGRLAADLVARLREGGGYRDLVEDLAALVRMIQEVPGAVEPGSPVSQQELDRVSEVVRLITIELGGDSDPDLVHTGLLDDRRKLAVLLVRAQGQLRRAMEFLRYDQQDAAELVPSLYVSNAARARAAEVAAASEPTAAPTQPAPPPDSPFVS